MLTLYGHPFSSYTWKPLIALYANATPFSFAMLDPAAPGSEAWRVVAKAAPLGKFPVLADGERLVIEATSIIEHLDIHHPGPHRLLAADPDAALAQRTLDRVLDNYLENVTGAVIGEWMASAGQPDPARLAPEHARLRRCYGWLDERLADYPVDGRITLVECSAAPALFYADWIEPIGAEFPRLKAWRAHLLALPPVTRCVDEARPWRGYFPPGAPDRD